MRKTKLIPIPFEESSKGFLMFFFLFLILRIQILSVKSLIMLKQIKSYPETSENENEQTGRERNFI